MLRDDLKDDLRTFVSTAEFAQMVDVDGVLLPAQVVKHTAAKSQRLTEQFDKLHGDFSELYFPAEPYLKKHGKLPVQGNWIWIDKVRYDVLASQNDLGMMHLTLAAYRQDKPRFRV